MGGDAWAQVLTRGHEGLVAKDEAAPRLTHRERRGESTLGLTASGHPTRAALGPGPCPPHEVDHLSNEGDDQEQVNKPAGNVKCKPAKSP